MGEKEKISDKEFMDSIHNTIHSLRLINGYKPSAAEIKISKLVIEKYSNTCRECREREEQLKNAPKQQSFFSKIGEAINDDS